MKLWLFFLPCTCVTSYAGIVYQSECEIINTPTTAESVHLSVTGGQSCTAHYGGTRDWPPASATTLGRGTLPSIDVQAYASPGGAPTSAADYGPYVGRANISVEANDRILIFGADVAAAHLVVRSWGYSGLDTYGSYDASFRFNGTPLSLHLFPPVNGESFTLAAGRAFQLEASLIADAWASSPLIVGSSYGEVSLTIESIELLDANGQSLSGYTWASQSGWNYNFIGGQQVFTPEPVATLPIGALLLIAYEAIRRHRAARRSVI